MTKLVDADWFMVDSYIVHVLQISGSIMQTLEEISFKEHLNNINNMI